MPKKKLTAREEAALRDIAKHTRTPTKNRAGYSKFWTPKTNERLAAKGLVEFVESSVVVSDAGLDWINT